MALVNHILHICKLLSASGASVDGVTLEDSVLVLGLLDTDFRDLIHTQIASHFLHRLVSYLFQISGVSGDRWVLSSLVESKSHNVIRPVSLLQSGAVVLRCKFNMVLVYYLNFLLSFSWGQFSGLSYFGICVIFAFLACISRLLSHIDNLSWFD